MCFACTHAWPPAPSANFQGKVDSGEVTEFQHLHPLLLHSAALWASDLPLATNITHRSRTVMVNGHLRAKLMSRAVLADLGPLRAWPSWFCPLRLGPDPLLLFPGLPGWVSSFQPHRGLTTADSILSNWRASEIRLMYITGQVSQKDGWGHRWHWNPGPGKLRLNRDWVGTISHTGTPVQKAGSPGTGLIPGDSNPKKK